MNIILLERVGNLGDLGDQVVVKNGYARNYLIPIGKAVRATEANRKTFETRRAELERVANAKLTGAAERAAKLAGQRVTVIARASDEGRLYGSVGTVEIARALTEAVLPVAKSEVRLPEGCDPHGGRARGRCPPARRRRRDRAGGGGGGVDRVLGRRPRPRRGAASGGRRNRPPVVALASLSSIRTDRQASSASSPLRVPGGVRRKVPGRLDEGGPEGGFSLPRDHLTARPWPNPHTLCKPSRT